MAQPAESLGNVMNPDNAWVAKVSEPALEPEPQSALDSSDRQTRLSLP